jgi:hypothetical protein
MAIRVRSTDGNNGDNGSTWPLAKATIAGADAIDVAGDTIYVSQVHAESTAGSLSWAFAGTLTNPTRVVCCNDGADPPTAPATSATVATTGTTNIQPTGNLYVYGLQLTVGDSIGSSLFVLNNGANAKQVWESCDFIIGGTGSSGAIFVGSQSSVGPSETHLNNCRMKMAAIAQTFGCSSKLRVNGGSIIAGGTTPTNFIGGYLSNRALDVVFTGFDFSNFSSGVNLCLGGSIGATGKILFRYCKLPASWSGSLVSAAITTPGIEIEMEGCDAGAASYRYWKETYGGSIKHETTIVRSSGASDGSQAISWKLATPAAVKYPLSYLESQELQVWNATIGSSVTATVEIVHDSLTNLTDAEVWLRVLYLSASGATLATLLEDVTANVLTTAADQTTSSVTWTTTGLTNPNKQKLSVTFTPQVAGYLIATVILAKPSKTIYVDPKITVTGVTSSRQAQSPGGAFINETGSASTASYSRGRVVNAGAV